MTGREDVIRVILCAAYMLLLVLPREVVRGWVVRRRLSNIGRGTVDPEVWTWQLIRESRWRFAGLMEDIPTLLPLHYRG